MASNYNINYCLLQLFCSPNILIDASMRGKLGDFGFSKEMPLLKDGRSIVTAAIAVKSAGYAAPELDACQHSPKTDVYAYGVVSIIINVHNVHYVPYSGNYLWGFEIGTFGMERHATYMYVSTCMYCVYCLYIAISKSKIVRQAGPFAKFTLFCYPYGVQWNPSIAATREQHFGRLQGWPLLRGNPFYTKQPQVVLYKNCSFGTWPL